jgi:hypothetical protein
MWTASGDAREAVASTAEARSAKLNLARLVLAWLGLHSQCHLATATLSFLDLKYFRRGVFDHFRSVTSDTQQWRHAKYWDSDACHDVTKCGGAHWRRLRCNL